MLCMRFGDASCIFLPRSLIILEVMECLKQKVRMEGCKCACSHSTTVYTAKLTNFTPCLLIKGDISGTVANR